LSEFQLRARRPGLLLDVVVDLLVVRQEVEHPGHALSGPPSVNPELILREVGLELRDHASRGSVLRRCPRSWSNHLGREVMLHGRSALNPHFADWGVITNSVPVFSFKNQPGRACRALKRDGVLWPYDTI